jgi:CBS domain containing-hemolysin-like protein
VSTDPLVWIEIVVIFALLVCAGFFSSAETSLFSLDRTMLAQMRRDNHPGASVIERLLSQPRRLIVTILIGTEFVNVTSSAMSTGLVLRFFGPDKEWLNVFIMLPVLLLLCDIVPKTLAIRHNVRFATFQAPYVDVFARAVSPVRWVLRRVSDWIITLLVGKARTPASISTEDIVKTLAAEAVDEGSLDTDEARYIHQIFEFGDMTMTDVATPRSQMFVFSASMPLDLVARELRRTRHTKVPVHEDGDKDKILGILFARDLLGIDLRNRNLDDDRATLLRLLRKPYFVPESRLASDLFITFRRRKLSLALTVDEFGGVTGLVTMEDLLECIFGDFASRSENIRRQSNAFESLGDGRYRIDASMTIHEFNRLIGANFDDEEVETVAGMLLHEFGELPPEGQSIQAGNFAFTVTSVAGNRIREAVVRAVEPPGEPAPVVTKRGEAPETRPPRRREGVSADARGRGDG